MFCSFIKEYKTAGLRRFVSNVRVRFAPSPTGYMHIGGLRMALINYLYAKKNNGDFILRIEDTDRNRIVQDSISNILTSLNQFQLIPDESVERNGSVGPYIQSERLPIYHKYAEQLVLNGSAYYCFCSSQDRGKGDSKHNYHCPCSCLPVEDAIKRKENGEKCTIRLRMPDSTFVLTDLLRGEIRIHGSSVEDAVLIKSDGFPTYHLASVVDDHLMNISTVIRGEEWISSIPKHLQLYKCLGWKEPDFIHLPLILSEKKTKISKRSGGFELKELISKGYLPSALINYIYLLGCKRGNDEINGDHLLYTLEEVVNDFSIQKLSTSPICVNPKLLDFINQKHIQYSLKNDEDLFIEYSKQFVQQQQDLSNQKNLDWKLFFQFAGSRIHTLQNVVEFVKQISNPGIINYSSFKPCTVVRENHLSAFYGELIEDFKKQSDFTASSIKNALIKHESKDEKMKKMMTNALRFCLTGSKSGFSLSEMMELIGKDSVIQRIEDFVRWLQ